jgi:hypothetical protein
VGSIKYVQLEIMAKVREGTIRINLSNASLETFLELLVMSLP